MNLGFLRTLLVEELRTLHAAQTQVCSVLPRMERAALSSEVRDALHRRLELEHSQLDELQRIFGRLEIVAGEGRSPGMEGILEEAVEVLCRESGVYPANLDPRLLSVIRKVGHYKMASLKGLLVSIHLLETEELEAIVADFLLKEIEADQYLAELAEDVLRLTCASSEQETMAALEGLGKTGRAAGVPRRQPSLPRRRARGPVKTKRSEKARTRLEGNVAWMVERGRQMGF